MDEERGPFPEDGAGFRPMQIMEPVNPMTLLKSALDRGLDIEKLDKLMDLAERWEAGQAARAFGEAVKAFQLEMPAIVKGNPVRNKDGDLMYRFANFDDI